MLSVERHVPEKTGFAFRLQERERDRETKKTALDSVGDGRKAWLEDRETETQASGAYFLVSRCDPGRARTVDGRQWTVTSQRSLVLEVVRLLRSWSMTISEFNAAVTTTAPTPQRTME